MPKTAEEQSLQSKLLPAALAGSAGLVYGASQAPGDSVLRGALIGGLGGAGAGLGLAAGNAFMESDYSKNMRSPAIGAAMALGGGALGLHGGLIAGRAIAKRTGMGDEDDRTSDDLKEIDIMRNAKYLPAGLGEYVKRSADNPNNELADISDSRSRTEARTTAGSLVGAAGGALVGNYGASKFVPGLMEHYDKSEGWLGRVANLADKHVMDLPTQAKATRNKLTWLLRGLGALGGSVAGGVAASAGSTAAELPANIRALMDPKSPRLTDSEQSRSRTNSYAPIAAGLGGAALGAAAMHKMKPDAATMRRLGLEVPGDPRWLAAGLSGMAASPMGKAVADTVNPIRDKKAFEINFFWNKSMQKQSVAKSILTKQAGPGIQKILDYFTSKAAPSADKPAVEAPAPAPVAAPEPPKAKSLGRELDPEEMAGIAAGKKRIMGDLFPTKFDPIANSMRSTTAAGVLGGLKGTLPGAIVGGALGSVGGKARHIAGGAGLGGLLTGGIGAAVGSAGQDQKNRELEGWIRRLPKGSSMRDTIYDPAEAQRQLFEHQSRTFGGGRGKQAAALGTVGGALGVKKTD